MNSTQEKHYCVFCKKESSFHQNQINHGKELVRSLFTLGLWLPVWIGMTLVKVKICDTCGNALSE